MRLPRDISGEELARKLAVFGYVQTRQVGSHMRLTTQVRGEHHITIPAHDPLRVGTLNAILRAVGEHHGLERNEVIRRCFP
jgi:predicted RNA binding protein YcfA (HicA-like mRNA interferase family)